MNLKKGINVNIKTGNKKKKDKKQKMTREK